MPEMVVTYDGLPLHCFCIMEVDARNGCPIVLYPFILEVDARNGCPFASVNFNQLCSHSSFFTTDHCSVAVSFLPRPEHMCHYKHNECDY